MPHRSTSNHIDATSMSHRCHIDTYRCHIDATSMQHRCHIDATSMPHRSTLMPHRVTSMPHRHLSFPFHFLPSWALLRALFVPVYPFPYFPFNSHFPIPFHVGPSWALLSPLWSCLTFTLPLFQLIIFILFIFILGNYRSTSMPHR